MRTEFLEQPTPRGQGGPRGHLAAIEFIEANPDEAQTGGQRRIETITEKPLPDSRDRRRVEEPDLHRRPASPRRSRSRPSDAEDVGLLEPVDLEGIYDLTLLNELLKADGQPEVKGL